MRKENVDLLALLVTLDQRVLEVLLDSLALLVLEDIRVNAVQEESADQGVNVEIKVLLELMANQEVQVQGDHVVQRENQEVQEELEHLVTLATLDNLALKDLPGLKASKDQLEPQDHKDLEELQENKALMALMALLDPRVRLVYLDSRVLQDPKDLRVRKEKSVLLAMAVLEERREIRVRLERKESVARMADRVLLETTAKTAQTV